MGAHTDTSNPSAANDSPGTITAADSGETPNNTAENGEDNTGPINNNPPTGNGEHDDPGLKDAEPHLEDIQFIPVLDGEAVDQLTTALKLTDWFINFTPADKKHYEANPDEYNVTVPPLRSNLISYTITKLLDNHQLSLIEGRFLKLISRPNAPPPWRMQLRLHNTDDSKDIGEDLMTNGLQVPTTDFGTLDFVVDVQMQRGAAHADDFIGYKVKWGTYMHVTQEMIHMLIQDFDARIPIGFPKVLHKAPDGTITYTGHWTVSRGITQGFDPKAGMRIQSKDSAMIFRVSKDSLLQHTEGINRHLAAPPYVYMPVIHQNMGQVIKLEVDIMGYGYCKGMRTTHDEAKKDSPEDEYSDKDSCPYCTKGFNTATGRFYNMNRCRNLFCAMDMGIRSTNPKAYDELRISHDCVLEHRQLEGLMIGYHYPPVPEVQAKQWKQATPAESLHHQASVELQTDAIRKTILAEQARMLRETAAKAKADYVPPPEAARNRMGTQPAKKRKIFGAQPKWPT